jgi:hypothetical protein
MGQRAGAGDTPSHWSVTFATARRRRRGLEGHRARRAGDRPAVRRPLVIGDPQGATFSASKFVPEKDLSS